MGFTYDIKMASKTILGILGIIIFLIFPWSSLFVMPDFLMFLNNITVLEYINNHSELFMYLFIIIVAVFLPIVIFKSK